MGRIASIASAIAQPLGFTALSYGIGRLSGQDNEEALYKAIPAVAASYAGYGLAKKLLPYEFNLKLGQNSNPVGISPAGIVGSVVGGQIGSHVGNAAYEWVNPEQKGREEAEVNPLLYAVDELSLPAFQLLKGWRK